MQETQVWSLGQKHPLEKAMAVHSSIRAQEIPWTEEPGGPQSMESQRVGHGMATKQQFCLPIHSNQIDFFFFFAFFFFKFPLSVLRQEPKNECVLDWFVRKFPWLLGAGVTTSTHGKGHEEGGSTYAKAGSSLRSSPGNSWASTPIPRACLLYYFVLSPTPLTLQGAVPHHLFQRRS